MTISHDYLQQLREDWRWHGHTDQSRRACEQLRRERPDLALEGLEDLYQVVAALDRGGARSVIERARIIEALLEGAHTDPLRRALLQALLPGVISVCRQLRFGQGIVEEPRECVATAVSLLSELIVDWAGQSRPYAAPDLLSALRGRLRRWLLKEKRTLVATSSHQEWDCPATEVSPLLTRLQTLQRGPHERLARLTFQCVFAGVPLRELAREDRSSLPTLKRELQVFALAHLLG